MNHQFVVMWSNEGLEYVADITEDNQRVIVEALKGNESPRHSYANPFHLRLRAQYNPQRHYEIYIVEGTDGFTADDIRDMFTASPQTAAVPIREKGECFYSNRAEKQPVIV